MTNMHLAIKAQLLQLQSHKHTNVLQLVLKAKS